MPSLSKFMISAVVSFAVIAVMKEHITLLYSDSNSLPYHYFLNLKTLSPSVGTYACFESPWYGGKVIKEIIGKTGDAIEYDKEGNLWVGRKFVGKQKRKARDGRPLTPIEPSIIPNGFVFVKGTHDRSFDSRYKEMGLIPQSKLKGRVIGLI